MKRFATSLVALGATCLAAWPAEAAFLIAVDTDGQAQAGSALANVALNPRVTFGGDTTAPGGASAHSTAVGLPVGNSIFAGDGVSQPDTYVFNYDMTADGDNLVLAPGTMLNDDGPLFRDKASGLPAGGPGEYNVWTTWPETNNVTGGPTRYELLDPSNAVLFSVTLDQNSVQGRQVGTPPQTVAGGEWIYLGTATLDGVSTYRLVQSVTLANTFASMRAEGVLFEPVAVPEPASAALVALVGLGLVTARRRG